MAPGGEMYRLYEHFGENVLRHGSHEWLPYSKNEVRLKSSNTNLSFLRRYCPGTQIGSPIRGSRRFCSAAAAVIVFAAAPVVVAAVAEKEDQDEDPPPVVAAEAIAQIIVAAHKITSEMD